MTLSELQSRSEAIANTVEAKLCRLSLCRASAYHALPCCRHQITLYPREINGRMVSPLVYRCCRCDGYGPKVNS